MLRVPGTMARAKVLDTSALIYWPIDLLRGGFVVENQKKEINRVAPERSLIIQAADLNWTEPSKESLERAVSAAMKTGDLASLSETDLAILAIAIEKEGRIFTDDYRLQNTCSNAGIPWSTVELEGIAEIWTWEIRCKACSNVTGVPKKTRPSGTEIGECEICGSELTVVRKR